jgi:hypothetical protein
MFKLKFTQVHQSWKKQDGTILFWRESTVVLTRQKKSPANLNVHKILRLVPESKIGSSKEKMVPLHHHPHHHHHPH